MLDTVVLSRIIIEVRILKCDEPDSDEAYRAGNWEDKLYAFRDRLELAARSAAPNGTTVTID